MIVKKLELKKEVRQDLVKEIKGFIQENLDVELSDFRAAFLLDFLLATVGPAVYNQAIQDAQQFMGEKVEELYALDKHPRK